MHFFNVVTVFVIFVLLGIEFCVSVFINPVIRQLEDEPHASALSLFARLLGGVMPFWYGASLLLLVAEAWLHRGSDAYPC
jgi:Na+/H+ antiporter NhaA